MQDEAGEQAVLLLSQSHWTDPVNLDGRSEAGSRSGSSSKGEFDLHLGFNSEADQRVASKIDRLLSDIERRVEAKEELVHIQDRVKMSIMEHQDPITARTMKSRQHLQHKGNAAPHFTIEQRKKNQNIYQGLPVEHRVRLATSSSEEMNEKVGRVSMQTARQTGMLGEMSAWFGQAKEVDFGTTYKSHGDASVGFVRVLHKSTCPEVLDAVPHDKPTHNPRPGPRIQDRIDLSSEEGLRQHMESLDVMMASVREAASTLQNTHETVLQSRGQEPQRRWQDLEKRGAIVKKSEARRKGTDRRTLGKTRAQLKKKDGIISGLKSALRESQLMVDKQAVEVKAKNEQIDVLKRHVRRLQRDVEDSKGIGQHMRLDAEVARNKLAEDLNELEKAHAVLETELISAKRRLASVSPRVITPTRHIADTLEAGKDTECQIRQQYQSHIDEIERNNALAMQRLQAQMLRMEGSTQQNNDAQMRGVASIMKQQKERMLAAMDRQRKQFDVVMAQKESDIKSIKVERAREIESLKNKWDKDCKDKMASLLQKVEEAGQGNSALLWRVKREHAKQVAALKNAHEKKLRNINDGATTKLVNVLQTKQVAGVEFKRLQMKVAEVEKKMAAKEFMCEKQRLSLANKAQTIIGLEYQISTVKAELIESKKNASRLCAQVETSNKLLDDVRQIAKKSESVVLGADQDMQLTPEEAQTMITTLGSRVMQLEQSLAQAKPSSPEISKVQRNENSRHDGFRQFERFSYMPKILTGIGESLTACAQLSSTLHLLREVPNWVDSLPALAAGDRDKSANANQARDRELKSENANMGTVDPLVMGKGNYEEDGLASTEQRAWQNGAKMFRWEQDWAEHLSVLADRIDGMIEMFRTAVTGFRAEIIQRKHYEEVMCLHFYKREQHWKALYEAMMRSYRQRDDNGQASRLAPEAFDTSSILSAETKPLFARPGVKQVKVQQPLLLKNLAKGEDGAIADEGNRPVTGNVATAMAARNNETFTVHFVQQESKDARKKSPPYSHQKDKPAHLPPHGNTTSTPMGNVSRQMNFLPRGLSQSGVGTLERSAAGATFHGNYISQPAYAMKGWTPIPPPSASISNFSGPRRSPKHKRLSSTDASATPASTRRAATPHSYSRPGVSVSLCIQNEVRSRPHKRSFVNNRVERGRGIALKGERITPQISVSSGQSTHI